MSTRSKISFADTYFVNITKSLKIPAWNPENSRDNTDLEKIFGNA